MRSEYCGLVNRAHLDQTLTLCGWVHRRRDHGGVIFIDLRDREGIVQIVCDPDTPETFKTADRLRNEFVIEVTGRVRSRPGGDGQSGAARAAKWRCWRETIAMLNPSLTPPFQIDDENLNENVRLEHRVLDLRRPYMQKNLRLRYRAAMAVRSFLDRQGFIDIETPMLTRSTPEGARDYLVPSRVHPGEFFALPQSPQLFKQMLMVAGLRPLLPDREVLPRRGPARRPPARVHADRHRDLVPRPGRDHADHGRADPRGVQGSARRGAAGRSRGSPTTTRWRATARDKPDLRVPLELTELTDVMKSVAFKVFSGPANLPGGRVAALRVPGGGALTRGEIDGYTEFVKIYGAKGLA